MCPEQQKPYWVTVWPFSVSDCVNQGILLSKLNCYEIQGKAEQWDESYLNDKKPESRN